MKKLSLLCLMFLANFAFADLHYANISKTNWSISNYIDYSTYSRSGNSYNTFEFSLSPEYFIKDRFSLGSSLELFSGSSNVTTTTIGPSLTYHFWQQEKISVYANAAFLFGLTDASYNSILRFKLGMNYFITPAVSFGPSFAFRYYDSDFYDLSKLSFAAGFSIYL